MVRAGSLNLASRRSMLPPPIRATAVNLRGAVHLPLRLKPPMTETARWDEGWPPTRATAARGGGGRLPGSGHTRQVMGQRLQVAERLRGVRGTEPLVEFVHGQPALAGRLPQDLGDMLAV